MHQSIFIRVRGSCGCPRHVESEQGKKQANVTIRSDATAALPNGITFADRQFCSGTSCVTSTHDSSINQCFVYAVALCCTYANSRFLQKHTREGSGAVIACQIGIMERLKLCIIPSSLTWLRPLYTCLKIRSTRPECRVCVFTSLVNKSTAQKTKKLIIILVSVSLVRTKVMLPTTLTLGKSSVTIFLVISPLFKANKLAEQFVKIVRVCKKNGMLSWSTQSTAAHFVCYCGQYTSLACYNLLVRKQKPLITAARTPGESQTKHVHVFLLLKTEKKTASFHLHAFTACFFTILADANTFFCVSASKSIQLRS